MRLISQSSNQIPTVFGSGYVLEQHRDDAFWRLAPSDQVGGVVASLTASMFDEILKVPQVGPVAPLARPSAVINSGGDIRPHGGLVRRTCAHIQPRLPLIATAAKQRTCARHVGA